MSTSEEPFADVPLLREIQRVLAQGGGPINWELARQIGIAVAQGQGPDPEPTPADREGFDQTVRAAELAVADLTGTTAPEHVTHVRAVRRAAWVEENTRSLRGLFEPAAERLARAMAEAPQPEALEGAAGIPGLEAFMSQVGPLLMGAQVGVVLGTLGRQVLGQYEIPVPRGEEPALLFVVPNIAAFEREWSLEPVDFRAWVALHETTHAFDLGRPWVREHFLGLVRDLAEHTEFDLTGLEERLAGLDLSDPEQVREALGRPGDLLGGQEDPEQRLRLARLQAFMAAAEGHADHVMSVVGRRMLGSYAQIEEALKRRHEGRTQQERMVEELLGIDLKREQYRLGRSFCDAVVEQTDETTLSRMWEAAENLPSMPELEEPRLWLARIA